MSILHNLLCMTRVTCVSLEPMNVMNARVIDRKSSSTAGSLEHSVSRLGFKEHKAAQYLEAPQSQAVDFKQIIASGEVVESSLECKKTADSFKWQNSDKTQDCLDTWKH